MTTTIRLPRVFYVDHSDRDLPTPDMVKGTKSHVFVAASDPALPDLLSDAEYYADPNGPDQLPPGLRASAIATVRAIKSAAIN